MHAKFAAMSTADRAATLVALTDMCTKLALAGIRSSHGELSADDVRWHLASRRYGLRLADEVYGQRRTP